MLHCSQKANMVMISFILCLCLLSQSAEGIPFIDTGLLLWKHQGIESNVRRQKKAAKKLRWRSNYRSARRNVRSVDDYDECELAPWSEWEQCSVACGDGNTYRIRQWLTNGPMSERIQCQDEQLRESKPCSRAECPPEPTEEPPCVMEPWNEWSQCSTTCGMGERIRKRERRIKLDGDCDINTEEEEYNCIVEECPKDCEVSDWNDWSQCRSASTCGDGLRERSRDIISDAEPGGTPCTEVRLKEVEECEVVECGDDCQITPWEHWGECSTTCGDGHQIRRRQMSEIIPGACEAVRIIDKKRCREVSRCEPCKLGSWQDWTTCSATCGNGTRRRIRKVHEEAYNYACQNATTEETKDCHQSACPPVQRNHGALSGTRQQSSQPSTMPPSKMVAVSTLLLLLFCAITR